MNPKYFPGMFYLASFALPACVHASGESIFGIELFAQGLIGAIMLASSFGLSFGLWLPVLCWFGNFVFIYAYIQFLKGSAQLSLVCTAVSVVLMLLYSVFCKAVVNDGEDYLSEVSLSIGYFVWLLAPGALIQMHLIRSSDKLA